MGIKPFDVFVTQNSSFVLAYPARSVHPDYKYSLVIVEPRKHANFEFVCKTMLRFTNENWGLHVFHGNQNEEFVKNALKEVSNVIYTNLNVHNLSINDYNNLLTSMWFYEQIRSEKLLVFQTDSCLLKDGVDEFLNYDYVGAPWPHRRNEVGNGGFSLRSKAFCLRVCNSVKRPAHMNEDVYFSVNGALQKANFADYETACRFSCENIKTNTLPLGVHQCVNRIEVPNLNQQFEENFKMI
jgi:hypothetical protein